jgi:phage terminase Nu1 subunit (DNA packaging protein)
VLVVPRIFIAHGGRAPLADATLNHKQAVSTATVAPNKNAGVNGDGVIPKSVIAYSRLSVVLQRENANDPELAQHRVRRNNVEHRVRRNNVERIMRRVNAALDNVPPQDLSECNRVEG